MTRATTIEPDARCAGCGCLGVVCRARLGPCCPDCTCAPPPGPAPHRICSGSCNAVNDESPCAFCPCPACRRWFPVVGIGVGGLEQWRVEVRATEAIYVCEATACRHRWLETTSPAYCRTGNHCKVCGQRRAGITRGIGLPRPSDSFVFDPNDGLAPR